MLALFVVCKTELPDEKNLKLEYCYRNSQIKSNQSKTIKLFDTLFVVNYSIQAYIIKVAKLSPSSQVASKFKRAPKNDNIFLL